MEIGPATDEDAISDTMGAVLGLGLDLLSHRYLPAISGLMDCHSAAVRGSGNAGADRGEPARRAVNIGRSDATTCPKCREQAASGCPSEPRQVVIPTVCRQQTVTVIGQPVELCCSSERTIP